MSDTDSKIITKKINGREYVSLDDLIIWAYSVISTSKGETLHVMQWVLQQLLKLKN
jgi:hypothetical protein